MGGGGSKGLVRANSKYGLRSLRLNHVVYDCCSIVVGVGRVGLKKEVKGTLFSSFLYFTFYSGNSRAFNSRQGHFNSRRSP